MKKTTLITITLAITLIIGIGVYIVINRNSTNTPGATDETTDDSFTPFGRIPTRNTQTTATVDTPATTTNPVGQANAPTLRLLSDDPVGGYGASTTVVRWINRGRGNIYEARYDSSDVITLSNTVVPKIYRGFWNKNLTAFIGSLFSDDDEPGVSTLYAELKARVLPKVATTTKTSASTTNQTATLTDTGSNASTIDGTSLTPYELKGKNLPDNMITYTVSPKRDRIFMVINEDGYGVGYVASFDGKTVTKIFSSPVTQMNADWPEDNTIAITTKSSAKHGGYLYFVNPKTGTWNKILGPINGLTTKVSHDAKYVLVSVGGSGSLSMSIYTVSSGKNIDAIIHTIADKCAWGNFNKNMFYCAVPTQLTNAMYPDDWYIGTVSFADKIWQVDASTGEIHLVTSIVDQSDRVIDVFNLDMDQKDEYLFFMNKNDLSLWSFDLVANKIQ